MELVRVICAVLLLVDLVIGTPSEDSHISTIRERRSLLDHLEGEHHHDHDHHHHHHDHDSEDLIKPPSFSLSLPKRMNNKNAQVRVNHVLPLVGEVKISTTSANPLTPTVLEGNYENW